MNRNNNNIEVEIERPTPHAFRHPLLYGPIRETNIAIAGHSFVEGLERRLDEKKTIYSIKPTNQELLALEPYRIKPILIGQSGIYIPELSNFTREMRDMNLDAVVIDCGSNDLCKNTEITEILLYMKNICREYLSQLDIQCVVVCDVLHRRKIDPRWSTKSALQYNRDVDQYNELLFDWIRREGPQIQPWDHKNLADTRILGRDGVHPSTTVSAWRYQRSIRGALLRADSYTRY